MPDTHVTVVGNLTADPELRYTPSGVPVANLRLASTPSRYDSATNEWVDGETAFYRVTVWRKSAENAAASLVKGARCVVVGRLRVESYESREGEKRTALNIDADDLGPSLAFATAQVVRNANGGRVAENMTDALRPVSAAS